MTVGYLVDSFDLLNVGHLDLLSQANELCSRLVVGVLSDEFVEERLNCRIIVPLVERAALVSHLRGVDEVVVHDAATRLSLGSAPLYMVTGDVPADLVLPFAARVRRLRPGRNTASPVLRDALHPRVGEHVA